MKKLVIRVFTLFTLLIGVSTYGIDLSQSLDKASIPFEDQAVLTVTVSWPGNQIAYLFDRPVQPVLEKLRVQRFATSVSSQVANGDEVTTKIFTFTLVPTGSGIGRIEPMTVHYVSWPDSIPGDLVTSAMSLSISPAKPVNKSGNILGRLPIWGWIAIAVAMLTAAGGAGWVAYKKNKTPVVEVKSPAAVFLEGLAQLQTESGNDLKRFQTGLYRLLTRYVQAQYQIETSGQSAEQITQAIYSREIPANGKEKLTGWLLRADREKFSPLPPTPGETIRLEAELRSYFETL